MTTIQLHDVRQAVLDYLSTVLVTTVQQVKPAPNSPGSINPNEIGTFSVKVDNTGNDTNGVPLINLRHHFKFATDVGAEFIVPDFGIARTGTSTSDSKLNPTARVKEYVLFPDNDTLDFNHHALIEDLQVVAPNHTGDVTITCHTHAEPDPQFLFPSSERDKDGTRTFKVT
jgi:hypothetical protein